MLDGVFAQDRADAPVFRPAPPVTPLDIAEVLATVEARVRRLLERRGWGEDDAGASDGDVWAEEATALAGLASASVQGQVAWGCDRGARVARLGNEPPRMARGRRVAAVPLCVAAAGVRGPAQRVERRSGAAAVPAAVACACALVLCCAQGELDADGIK